MKIFTNVTAVLISCAVFLTSCTYHNLEELGYSNTCDTSYVSYSDDIVNIIKSHCLSCHANGVSRYHLQDYKSVYSAIENGKLIPAITHAPGAPKMPFENVKLDDCTIRKIIIWAENGAPEN